MSSEKLLKKFYKKILLVIQSNKKDKEVALLLKQLLISHAKNNDFAKVFSRLGLHDVLLLVNVLKGESKDYHYSNIDYSQVFSDYIDQLLPIFQNYVDGLKYQTHASRDNLEVIHNQLGIVQMVHSGVKNRDILSVINGLIENYEVQPEAFKNLTIATLNKIGRPVVLALVYTLCQKDNVTKSLPEILQNIGYLAMPALLIALHYPEEEVRYGAVDVVRKIPADQAIEALVSALNDPSFRVRAKVLESFQELMDHRVTPFVITALQDSSAIVRLEAVKCLGQIRSYKALNALLPMLEDDDWEVRREVVDSMALYGSSASGYLAKALENDSLVVKKIASRLLADLGTEEAVPALMKAIYDNDISVRERAVIALGRIQGENSIVTLMFAFEDKAPLVRFAAIQVLVEVGSKSTVHLLNRALKDSEPLIRERANVAIQEILSREEI